MDIGRAFVYPFEDPDWLKKIVIVAVISLIPVIGQIWLLGWSIEITRRVIKKDPIQLAGFDDFGGMLMLGLKAFVIGFVYSIPMFFFILPPSITPLIFDPNQSSALISLVITCFTCLMLLYGILLAFIFPAAFGELAATDQLGSAIHPGRILGLLRADPGAYVITWLGAIAAGFIAGLGIILCFVGVIFTMTYAYAIIGHLYGQAYIQATEAA